MGQIGTLLNELQELKKKYPEEYEILIKAAQKVFTIISKDELESYELDYSNLAKDEALQLATALIRRSREDQTQLKRMIQNVTDVLGTILKGMLASALI